MKLYYEGSVKMNVVLDNSISNSFISEIEENSGIIRWQYEKCNRPDYILIVQTPFSSLVDIAEIIRIINESKKSIELDKVISITPDISCKLTSVSQGTRGVYNVNVMPANYSVYGCKKENGDLTVYEEENKDRNRCKVSSIIEYKIEDNPVIISSGRVFRRTETKYNFSKITVFENKYYIDGVLFYTFDECEIKFPISKQMLGKPFYVRWYDNSKPPIIRTNYDGFKSQKR